MKYMFTLNLTCYMLFSEKCPATISIFGRVNMKANLVDLKSWRKKAGEVSQLGQSLIVYRDIV